MKHMMVDIETLGTRPGSVIVAIGAINFGTEIAPEDFYIKVDLADAQKRGLTLDAATVAWWMQQSDAARQSTFGGTDRVSLNSALAGLTRFWEETKSEIIWSHGSVFDIVLLEKAYSICDLPPPWKFYNVRDTRTIYDLAEVNPKEFFGTSTTHNAVDDARAQAQAVIASYKKLGLT